MEHVSHGLVVCTLVRCATGVSAAVHGAGLHAQQGDRALMALLHTVPTVQYYSRPLLGTCESRVSSFALWYVALQVLVQLCMALDYMHSKGIAHRDIKLANIFLTSFADVRLGDFGTCRGTVDLFSTLAGTPIYMAPEVLRNEPYTLVSDIW